MFNGITLFSKEWKKDILIGLAFGIGFILLNLLSPAISIGLPNLGLAVSALGTIIVVGLLAPIIEEILFRGALLGLLFSFGVHTIITVLLGATAFSLYHYLAYGATLSASGAFIGAFIFAIIATVLALWRKSLLPGIILHSVFNIFLLSKLAVVF